jgi:type IV pilus assembly protein PilM
MMFRKKPVHRVGIDIGASSLRLLELRRLAGHTRLEHYACRALPESAVVGKQVRDVDAVGSALQQCARSGTPAPQPACIAVPGAAAIIKTLALDAALTDAELEQQMGLEAAEHVPYALEEVAVDYARLPSQDPGSQGATVLLVACRQDHMAARLLALQLGGFTAHAVDVETFAIQRASHWLRRDARLPPARVVAVLDIDVGMTTLYLLANGSCQHLQEQATPLEHAGLAAALVRSLQFLCAASRYGPVELVLLAGALATTPALAATLGQATQVPTVVADPFAGMELGADIDRQALQQEAPALLLALGLALWGCGRD